VEIRACARTGRQSRQARVGVGAQRRMCGGGEAARAATMAPPDYFVFKFYVRYIFAG
jgi:hypothetical protein